MEKIRHSATLLLIYIIALAVVLLSSSCGYIRACRNAKGMPTNGCMGRKSNMTGYYYK